MYHPCVYATPLIEHGTLMIEKYSKYLLLHNIDKRCGFNCLRYISFKYVHFDIL